MLSVITRKKWLLLTVLVFLLVIGVNINNTLYAGFEAIKIFPVFNPITSSTPIFNTSFQSNNNLTLAKQCVRDQSHTSSEGSLSQDVVNGVNQFLLFVGYPRSSHSILGSLIDAHPHVIVAHELFLLDEWWSYQERTGHTITKELLYNALYNSSNTNVHTGWRNTSSHTKGYSLSLGAQWQGQFNRNIAVIGDKSGGNTAYLYMKSPGTFLKRYEELKRIVKVPIRVIHVVRNPFDIIATTTMYESGKIKYPGLGRGAKKVSNYVHKIKTQFKTTRNKTSDEGLLNQARLNDKEQLNRCIEDFFKMAAAVKAVLGLTEDSVLEVHNYEMVRNPAVTIRNVCHFLGVSCPEEYVRACASKIFRQLSLSREYVLWGREEVDKVNKMKLKYFYYERYSFHGDT